VSEGSPARSEPGRVSGWLDVQRTAALVRAVAAFFVLPAVIGRLSRREQKPFAVRLRLFLESLGITYHKLGQYLALRWDVLPREVCDELAKMFEHLEPLPFEAVKERIEFELDGPLEQFFASVDPTPIGTASIAQVHRATTLSGELVALKVQRPRITQIFRADTRNLGRLASILDRLGITGEQPLRKLVDEFARFTVREMDFRQEAQTADRMGKERSEHAYIPKVYWETTTSKLLTLEFIDGISLGKAVKLIEEGPEAIAAHLDPGAPTFDVIADHISRAVLHQLFITGFFHGDPHPGNVLIQRDGTVTLIDFGIFGQLSNQRRQLLADWIETVATGQIEESYRHYVQLLTMHPQTDTKALKREIIGHFQAWYDVSKDPDATAAEKHLGSFWGTILAAYRRHRVSVDEDQLLFWRALLTVDTNALLFSTHYDLIEAIGEFFREHRPSPAQRVIDLFGDEQWGGSLLGLARDMPSQARRFAEDLDNGRVEVPVRLSESPGQRQANDRAFRQLSLAILALAASIVVASGVIPTVGATTLASCGVLGAAGLMLWVKA